MSKEKEVFTGEWTPEQWQAAWNIQVGRVFACRTCGTMVIVSRGGVGNLEPICCKKMMELVSRPCPEGQSQ